MSTFHQTYGVVPRAIYPESFSSSSSSGLNTLLKLKLREHAVTLRKLITSLRSSASLPSSPEERKPTDPSPRTAELGVGIGLVYCVMCTLWFHQAVRAT